MIYKHIQEGSVVAIDKWRHEKANNISILGNILLIFQSTNQTHWVDLQTYIMVEKLLKHCHTMLINIPQFSLTKLDLIFWCLLFKGYAMVPLISTIWYNLNGHNYHLLRRYLLRIYYIINLEWNPIGMSYANAVVNLTLIHYINNNHKAFMLM